MGTAQSGGKSCFVKHLLQIYMQVGAVWLDRDVKCVSVLLCGGVTIRKVWKAQDKRTC